VLSATERANLFAVLGSTPADANQAASVLRSVAENPDLKNAEFIRRLYDAIFWLSPAYPNDTPDLT